MSSKKQPDPKEVVWGDEPGLIRGGGLAYWWDLVQVCKERPGEWGRFGPFDFNAQPNLRRLALHHHESHLWEITSRSFKDNNGDRNYFLYVRYLGAAK